MAEQELDAIIALKPQNTFFLSGYNPVFYSHPVVVVVPIDADPILLVHALRDDSAASESAIRDIRLYGAWGDKVTMGMSWSAALSTIVADIGARDGRIGLDLDFISLRVLQTLETALPAADFVDASELLLHARMVKDEDEIDALRVACTLTDRAIEAALPVLAERGTEREVAVAAVNAMQQAWLTSSADYKIVDFANTEGAVHSGLAAYCLAGERVARNADGPTNRRVADGELAMLFTFATCAGMHAEQERCVAVGEIDSKVLHAYDTFLMARQAIFDGLRPDITFADVYRLAAPIYEERGYASYMPGRMGHGIGLGAHEEPSIAPDEQTVLVPGMTITVEPNLRLPTLGGGGGQHSDTIVVTKDGFEFLTSFRRDMIRV
jgi:Xaa-Pro dipeptidase